MPRIVAGTDLMSALRQSIENDGQAAKSGSQTSVAEGARCLAAATKPAAAAKGKRTAKGNVGQREMLLPIAGGAPSKEAGAPANLLRDLSRSRQPPPGTVFALSRPLLAPFCSRSRPSPAGIALASGTLGHLGSSRLPAAAGLAALALGGPAGVKCRPMAAVDLVDRRHAVHGLEHALWRRNSRPAARSAPDRRRAGPCSTSGLSSARTFSPRAVISATRFSMRSSSMPSSTFSSITRVELEAALGQQPVERLAPAAPCAESRRARSRAWRRAGRCARR